MPRNSVALVKAAPGNSELHLVTAEHNAPVALWGRLDIAGGFIPSDTFRTRRLFAVEYIQSTAHCNIHSTVRADWCITKYEWTILSHCIMFDRGIIDLTRPMAAQNGRFTKAQMRKFFHTMKAQKCYHISATAVVIENRKPVYETANWTLRDSDDTHYM